MSGVGVVMEVTRVRRVRSRQAIAVFSEKKRKRKKKIPSHRCPAAGCALHILLNIIYDEV